MKMKLLNPNTPLSNFIYTILNEKNKQIKENILLGNINFPKILIYSTRKEENTFKSNSHITFLNNLEQQRQLSEVREEKTILEKKVNMVDHQLLSIKNNNFSQNMLNYSQRYINTNLNNNKLDTNNNSKIYSNRHSSEKNSKSKNKNKKILPENINSLPTLGKEQIRRRKKVQNIALKPIQIKSFKSKSKINNQETEEKLEKNAKAFIQKINNNKKNVLAMINKRHEKFTLKLKNELEKIERQRKLKYDEYNNKNNNNKLYNYNNGYNNDNYNLNNNNVDYSNLNTMRREENKYSPNISNIRNNRIKNKKYYHYSPYNPDNPEMLKNISKDLLNFNSELYYNNNIPDIIQFQYRLAPLYKNKNKNILIKGVSSPLIYFEDNDFISNNNPPEIVDMTNGEITSNISRVNNYSYGDEATNNDNNIIDDYKRKHLYYFNELKYENEFTRGDNYLNQEQDN